MGDTRIKTNEMGTNLGPLTTTWTPPPSCTVNYRICPDCDGLYAGQQCIIKAQDKDSPVQDNYRCFPPINTKSVEPKAHPLMGWGYYSPGLACPTGFTAACTAVYNQRPDWPIQFQLREAETAIGCCPEGFQCGNRWGNTCIAIATESTKFLTATCSGTVMVSSVMADLKPDKVTRTITDGDSSSVEVVDRTYTMWAPMFQLNYRATDLPESSSTTAPKPGSTQSTASITGSSVMSTATGSGTEDGAGAAQSSDTSESSSSDSGLSTAAAAGIGAGIAVLAIFLIAIVAFLFWRRRRRHREGAVNDNQSTIGGPEKYGSGSGSGYVRQDDSASTWTANNFEMQPQPMPGHSGPRSELSDAGHHDYNSAMAYGRPYEPYKPGSPHSEMDGTPRPNQISPYQVSPRSEIDGTPKHLPAELSTDVPVELPTGR